MMETDRQVGVKAAGSAHTMTARIVPIALLACFALLTSCVQKKTPKREGSYATKKPARQWCRFRGPGGLGISPFQNIPTKWNGKTGENILWKTEIPLPGHNSPIVCNNKVFLAGADKNKSEVYCLDISTGRIVWKRPVTEAPSKDHKPIEVFEDTGHTPSTMATDGQSVYAIFVNGDLVCFDVSGKRVWNKNFGVPENGYGLAASLTLSGKHLIVQFDQGTEEHTMSILFAVDSLTGKTVWQTKRPVPSSWGTPAVIDTGKGKQIVTTGYPWVIAYEADSGKEIWKVKALEMDIVPSPIYANKLVYAVGQSCAVAIRPDGKGDVTQTHVAWKNEDAHAEITTPLCAGDLLFVVDGITVLCLNALDGKKVWEKELDEEFYASPALVGDRLYLVSVDGKTVIVAAAKTFKQFGVNELGEEVYASPAFADGKLLIRGKKHLFCIGKK